MSASILSFRMHPFVIIQSCWTNISRSSNARCANMKPTELAVLLLGIALVSTPAVGSAPTGDIGVYAENPFYWEYHGKPLLLLGGSSAPKGGLNDEGMFLWPDVASSLDRLVSA